MILSGKYFNTTGGISSQHELCFGDVLLIICFTTKGQIEDIRQSVNDIIRQIL